MRRDARAGWRRLALQVGFLVGLAMPALAQQPRDLQLSPQAKKALNDNRVGLVTGLPGFAYARMGSELATLLDRDGPRPYRVVVQLGRGSTGNLFDLLNLEKVDFALVQSDVVEAYRAEPATYDALRNKLQIVATLHREELHVLARGAQLTSLAALSGKRVNIGTPFSGPNLTARVVFDRLKINVQYDELPTTPAITKMVNGSIDAVFHVTGKNGGDIFRSISAENIDKADLHFIPVTGLGLTDYVSAQLTSDDYSNLIRSGQTIETVAVTALLVAYVWDKNHRRFAPAARFIDEFFTNVGKLAAPTSGFSHELWCQADLAGQVGAWKRFAPADEWLAKHKSAEPLLIRRDECRTAGGR